MVGQAVWNWQPVYRVLQEQTQAQETITQHDKTGMFNLAELLLTLYLTAVITILLWQIVNLTMVLCADRFLQLLEHASNYTITVFCLWIIAPAVKYCTSPMLMTNADFDSMFLVWHLSDRRFLLFTVCVMACGVEHQIDEWLIQSRFQLKLYFLDKPEYLSVTLA